MCALAGAWMLTHPAPPNVPPAVRAATSPGAEGLPQPAAAMARSRPVRLSVAALRIDAPITTVGMDEDGWLRAPDPSTPAVAGWYTGSATPGENGTAVIDGHVDTAAGPAVFYPLSTITPGTRVTVSRADGSTAVFTVYEVNSVPRHDFPTDRVYGGRGRPELRLITCGGTYSKSGGYSDNVVVYAYLST
ncbi:class F sortase [Streptomyces sp. NPDC089919]|uniref:class F sortase n=1 Tax=Streptomyces sp. NPDC089919 TaxID=3155188 RepID=UPI0034278A76